MPAAKTSADETVPESVPDTDQNVKEETAETAEAKSEPSAIELTGETAAAEIVAPPSCSVCGRVKNATEDDNATCWRCGYNPAAKFIHD